MFIMASEERTRELLEDAGFTVGRLQEVPVRFVYADVDEYVMRAQDTGGMFAKAWREASGEEQATIKAQLADSFASFAVDGGYELPGVALAAVAS